ncbi:MAG: hypothetical protein MPJ50_01880 [Pirellulales bacterium]|nr:hypothetical protein [Pirellulales bacterium]
MSNWKPDTDFPSFADATEAVTFVSDGMSTTEITEALRRRLTRRDVKFGGGRLMESDVFWHLPQSELAVAPKPGEKIIDSAPQTWTIVQVDHDVVDGRWRCGCRMSALSSAFVEEIDWLQTTWSKNEHGALDAEWTEAATELPAQVQVGEAEHTTIRGVRTLRQPATISLETALALKAGDRLRRRTSGELLDVTRFSPPQDVGGVFVVQTIPVAA